MDLQQRAVFDRWDLAFERVVSCRTSVFIRERSAWRADVPLPMPGTAVAIRALVQSAMPRVKRLFKLEEIRSWDRTPERILIAEASRAQAVAACSCPVAECSRWVVDFHNYEARLS